MNAQKFADAMNALTSEALQRFAAKGQAAQAAVDKIIDESQGKAVNVTPLLCRSAVRELFLDTAKQLRPFNKFSRVSEETLIAANAQLRAWIVQRVKSAPSKGVTL
jgi:hypothetical protein